MTVLSIRSVLLVLVLAPPLAALPCACQEAEELRLERRVVKGRSFWVADERHAGREANRSGNIYLFFGASDFSPGILRDLLTTFASAYDRREMLLIVAFSDKEMLKRAMWLARHPAVGSPPPLPNENDLNRKWEEEHGPAKTGYYRAYFSRRKGVETLVYSPDPDKAELVAISLTGR